MVDFINPFRPGAGHQPPYLAGRDTERDQFISLLSQQVVTDNLVLTGLRGVGKTVLLETLRPLASEHGWLWVGADLTESASMTEESLATRMCADLAPITATLSVAAGSHTRVGFGSEATETSRPLDYETLMAIYHSTPGVSLDKLKAALQFAWEALRDAGRHRGLIFAYDEAQTLSDQAENDQYPLALLLDAFQSLQRQGLPLMLALTGLPTILPKMVAARTYAERMFRVARLESLDAVASREAILRPIEDASCPLRLNDESVEAIVEMSGGYPYFIQFICREVYDAFLERLDHGEEAKVPVADIERKLDVDFFAGRWSRATDRQRDLLRTIARLEGSDQEFSVSEIVAESRRGPRPHFSPSHVNQMLNTLIDQGLVHRNRHGRYAFAIPLLSRFITRHAMEAPA